ncbi:MAG: C40 family peptidase [Saccharofermentanales bacterium]
MKLAKLLTGNTSTFIICAVMITILTSPVLSFPSQPAKPDSSQKLQEIELDSQVDYEPVDEYFDPANFDVINYARQDVELSDRSMDSEDLLFGSTAKEKAGSVAAVPPDLTFEEDDTLIYINANAANMREYPVLTSNIIMTFKYGDSIKRTGIGEDWDRVINSDGVSGYISAEFIVDEKPAPIATPSPKPAKVKIGAPVKANTLGKSIALEVQKYLGIRYRGGRATPDAGFDCSGLTWYVFNRYGISTPRGTSSYYGAGLVIPYSKIAPGDVIAWDTRKYDRRTTISHVSIYIGNGIMVHASSSNHRVTRVSVAQYKEWGCKIISVHRFIKK